VVSGVQTLLEWLREVPMDSETHIACACRPAITYCGCYSAEASAEVTTFESEPNWCAGCMDIFEGSGCGLCGCRFGALCGACEAL
jgi:hypothetical protein